MKKNIVVLLVCLLCTGLLFVRPQSIKASSTEGDATLGEATVGEATVGEATIGDATPGSIDYYTTDSPLGSNRPKGNDIPKGVVDTSDHSNLFFYECMLLVSGVGIITLEIKRKMNEE